MCGHVYNPFTQDGKTWRLAVLTPVGRFGQPRVLSTTCSMEGGLEEDALEIVNEG